jgi:hypothetical protein
MHACRVYRRSGRLAIAVLLLSAAVTAGCRDTSESGCRNEPLGAVSVWIENVEALEPIRFSGTLQAVEPADDGAERLTIIADDGSEWNLVVRLPRMRLPVAAGNRYEFDVQAREGWPSVFSLFTFDEEGLLFAGISDWDLGVNVGKEGVPGFDVKKIATECGNRPHGDCYDEMKNAVLRVEAGEESVTLYHGESSRLGDFEVICLTCQDVAYNDSCADAGVIGVSFVIARAPSSPEK